MEAVDIYHASLGPMEIRLVRILPGVWTDDIQCELTYESLVVPYSYKALSYVWGPQTVTRPILVDGQPLHVTANLECALRHLREHDQVVRIWIDALCINQKNNDERNAQVRNMHHIYRKATEVIAFLGEGITHRPKGCSKSKKTKERIIFHNDWRDDRFIADFANNWTTFPRLKKKPTVFDVFCLLSGIARSGQISNPLNHLRNFKEEDIGLLFEYLRMMMASPWWGRIWIVQEVIIASHVRVQCGNVTAPWEMFAQASRLSSLALNAVTIPRENENVLRRFAGTITDIEHRRKAWAGQLRPRGNFLSILREFSNRQASDDRDKVYALLTLAEGSTSIVPDYELDTPKLFVNTIKDIIRNDSALYGFCGDLGRKNRGDLPSWVPDWTATFDDYDRHRADLCDKYNACGGFSATICDSEYSYFDHLAHQMRLVSQYIKDEDISLPGAARTALLHFRAELKELEFDWRPLELKSIFRSVVHFCNELTQHYGQNTKLLNALSLADRSVLIHLPKSQFSETVSLPLHSWGTIVPLPSLMTPESDLILDPGGQGYVQSRKHESSKYSDCLKTRAFLVDRVSSCREPLFSLHDDRAIYESLETWMSEWNKSNSSYRRHEILTALVSDLKVTEGRFQRLQPWDYEHLEQWYESWTSKHFHSKEEVIESTNTEVQNPYEQAMHATLLRRKLFFTSNGLLGFGPYTMQEDDLIYILPGGKTPFVLRKRAELQPMRPGEMGRYPTQYQLVGDCYLQGAMDGGPWLLQRMKPGQGSLPDDIFLVAYQRIFRILWNLLADLVAVVWMLSYKFQFWEVGCIEEWDASMEEMKIYVKIYANRWENHMDKILKDARPLLIDFLELRNWVKDLDKTLIHIS